MRLNRMNQKSNVKSIKWRVFPCIYVLFIGTHLSTLHNLLTILALDSIHVDLSHPNIYSSRLIAHWSVCDKMWVSLIYSNTATTLFLSCVEINSTMFFVHIDLVCVRFANVSIAANNDRPFDSILSFVISQTHNDEEEEEAEKMRSLVSRLMYGKLFFCFGLYCTYISTLFFGSINFVKATQ